jgi:hypothetical protein
LNKDRTIQEKLKDILSYVYERGNKVEEITVSNLIEEIKKQFKDNISAP